MRLPSGDTLAYAYNAEIGGLASIADPRGNRYRYDYDLAGRIDSAVVGTASADGLVESRRYDAEGRLFQHVRSSAQLGTIYTDSLTLDALGRTVRVASGTRANGGMADTTRLYYSGLGAILARERTQASPSHWETEEFRVDGFGNVLTSRAGNSDFGGAGDPRYALYGFKAGGARGLMTSRATDGTATRETAQMSQSIDADGNVERSQDQVLQIVSRETTTETPTHQYYSADGKLRAVQRYRLVSTGTANGVFEEYRYDALGRRVVVIARHGTPSNSLCPAAAYCMTLCNTGCVESVTRTVWDGSAIAHEDRRPYPDGSITGQSFNSVEYVHGVETDRPFASLDWHLSSRALSWTWRGLAEASTAADGSAGDCSLGSGWCDNIAWLDGQGIYSRPVPTSSNSGGQTYLWAGSLLLDQQDKSGQHFRRNRYYDTQSGRFTQEDPIGLAGGMNLYGFAGGDPVNFSDPFGLCPEPISCALALVSGTSALAVSAAHVGATGVGALAAGTGSAGSAAIYSVYESVTEGKSYVGITKDLARRAGEHLRGPHGMSIEPILGGLTKADARGVEQVLIEARGLKKNGGDLLNQINSIAPSRDDYEALKARGKDLLKSIGKDP